jgi:hypothetical protein
MLNFFVCRRRRVIYLDGFFKVFLSVRTFQTEKKKNNGKEHADKNKN